MFASGRRNVYLVSMFNNGSWEDFSVSALPAFQNIRGKLNLWCSV